MTAACGAWGAVIKRHIAKWNRAAAGLESVGVGVERRYGHLKRELFGKARGETLLVAAGTGLDFQHLPEGLRVSAVDFSPVMLGYAKPRAKEYRGALRLVRGDMQRLSFRDASFDSVVTACTFCSVPDPLQGLRELHRVLRPGGRLLMFEHVRAGNPLLGFFMDVMTPFSSFFGPDMNRRTGETVQQAGFTIERQFNVYLDVVKIFECVKKLP